MTTPGTVPNPNGTSTIFVGSSLDLGQIADAAIASPLLSDGDVSFYGHLSGLVTSYEDGTEQSVLSEWSGTGPGLVELSQAEPMAIMSVTIANTGTTPLTLPIGTLVSSASGVQYQLVQKPRQEAGWSDTATGAGTVGAYTIQPGQSLALFAQALVDGPGSNLLADQVTQIAVPGAAITSSALITAAPQWGAGTVTLTNSSSASQIIYEGIVVNGSSGPYQIGIDSTVGGFVATDADSSSGYYVLKAGGSITVPISSIATITATVANGIVQQEQAEDAAANSITGGNLPTGVSVTGSSAITTQGVVQPSDQGHVASTGANTGFFTDSADALFTTYQGYVPTEADVNTYNDYIWTKQDLVNWEAYVDNARALGLLNLAPMMSEFETVDFATSAATAYARAGALYSGGIAFDLPPWFFLAREPAFQQSIEAEIRWATQNGLRSSITLSPESGDDTNFLSDTQQLVAILKAAGALPTQIVVKDGGVTGGDVIYSTTDPNSLNNVGNWLSSLTLTPSNSESGLESRGAGTRPDDLMTGVQQSEVITNAAAVLPYAAAQIFAESKATTATVTVTLGNVALGKLAAASGLGSVSANGATFTITGTTAQLTAGLQALSFTAANGALGSTTLTTVIVDAAGTITGNTALTIDNALALSGGPTALGVDAPVAINPAIALNPGPQIATLTATVTLSNPLLGSFWNMGGASVSADGSTLTLSGTAGTLQGFLRDLVFIPAPGLSGREVQTVSVSDGTQVASLSTAITVAAATGLAIDYVPVDIVSAPFVLDAPYQDILISDAGSPSQVLSATVMLPGGAATLLPSGLSSGTGTLSTNGLSYSFSGTASQLQAALRTLQVSVPASQTASTETLTLTVDGFSTVTTVKVASTDTVYVGAVDGTDGAYSSGVIAAPLLATGKVGLFDDYNGLTSVAVAGTGAGLAAAWSGASVGVFGFGESSDVGLQTITVRNTGTTPVTVPVGTLASTASGVQFQVIQYSGANANWSAGATGDGSLGVYTIAAGASITVPVEALAQGYAGNVAANAITTLSGIGGAAVTGSTPSVLATEYAGGTVTLTNTTNSYIIVNEGTLVTGANGSYVIGNDPKAADYSLRTNDSSVGIYYVPPGGSTTVPIYGVVTTSTTASLSQILAQTTAAANSITGGSLPSGISITGSSAIAAVGPTDAAGGATWGNWGANTGILTDRGYGYFVPGQGFAPSEANTNLTLGTEFTASDLTSWQGYVDTLRGLGILNVAPVVTSSNAVLDISSSDATANLRSAALYGGGIDFDLPPNYLLSLGQPTLTAIVDDIRWADANGLRSTITLRAYTDPSFLENTKTLLGELQAAGALPSQAVVVGSPNTAAPGNPELANQVAQYVAGLTLVPTSSESGLSTTTGTTVDAIVTGVRAAETATGPGAITPYAGVQVFTDGTTQGGSGALTAIVALTGTGLGTLSTSGAGTVSADGSTVTITGTPTALDAALAAIHYTPTSGALGKATLNLSIADTHGTIQGQTTVTVGNQGQAAALSLAALHPGSGITAISISTPAAEHDVLTATAGGIVSNGTFQISGTEVADAAALAGLKVFAGAGIAAPSLQVQLSGAAIGLTDTGTGHDVITSAGGNSLHTGSTLTTIAAGLGDTVSAGSESVFASGAQSFTFIGGSSAGDTVTGGAGGGSFTAGTGGRSVLTAGSGPTVLQAAGANDTLVGGGGTTLHGSANQATVLRTSGGDTAIGADGSTIVGPAQGTASIQASTGNETILGGSGAMSVAGGAGSLSVTLGTGNASVTGGSGRETILVGAGGRYTLTDGTGAETVTLQKGVSTNAQLFLNGFVPGRDLITLTGYGAAAGQQLVQTQAASPGSSGTVLKLSDGATITLSGISHLSATGISSF